MFWGLDVLCWRARVDALYVLCWCGQLRYGICEEAGVLLSLWSSDLQLLCLLHLLVTSGRDLKYFVCLCDLLHGRWMLAWGTGACLAICATRMQHFLRLLCCCCAAHAADLQHCRAGAHAEQCALLLQCWLRHSGGACCGKVVEVCCEDLFMLC